MTATFFRAAIVLSIVFPIAGGIVDFAFPQFISQGLAKAIEAEPIAGIFETPIGMGLVGLWGAASLAGAVGMFFFKAWARTITLWLTVVGFAIYPALGSTVSSWLASALTEAGAIAWGAMLAFAYTEPIKALFTMQPHDA
jgi:hypothetical protein